MADIFLSYASEDLERVRPLVEYLQSLGWSVWWSREGLVAGPSFDEKIEEAIADASCVVVAWSEASIASRWVRAEANEGLEREILVPLLLEDVRPPLVFRAAHTANLIGWPQRRPETELNALITGIRNVVGTTAEQKEVIDAAISRRSIAVLRFVDMSTEQDQGPLCAGIAEEILNKLARIRDLKVIARTSSFQFDPNNANIREIGKRLGVHHVLEGSVRTADNQVRITPQLIECEGESHRWSESYTRELVDLFTLYDEVADAIARKLDIVITAPRPKSFAAPTKSEEALRLVMQAQFELQQSGNPRHLFPLVERALALDPDYADGHLIQGQLYYTLANSGYALPEPNYLTARECLAKALLLNPNLAQAHWTMAIIRAELELDWGLAAESLRQAELLWGYPQRFNFLCRAGYYERAERDALRSIERDPLNTWPRIWLGRTLERLGRIGEATRAYEDALDVAPRHAGLFVAFVTHVLDFARDVERADRFLQETQYSGNALHEARARIAHVRGDSGPLRSLVQEWVSHRETRYVGALRIERAYYELGDYEEHIRWFAVREREKDGLSYMPITLRDHPDYWDRLTEWAIDDPADVRSRMALVNEHRARIDRITERMVLPPDFVE